MTGTVYIVDDDAAVRDSLALLLSLKGYAGRVYASGEDFLRAVPADEPGCVLLDLKMPGQSGLDVQRVLSERKNALPVVFLTGHGDVPSAVAALKAGAFDFLEKPPEEAALFGAIDAALARAARSDAAGAAASLAKLTERERAILDLVLLGRTSREIAGELGISPRTVEVHRAKLLSKLEARNTTELVRAVLPAIEAEQFSSRK